jgi:hypothetical protein
MMSAQNSVVPQIEDVLNIIRPNKHFAVWREGGKVECAAVDPDEVLMLPPGWSVKVAYVRAAPLDVQPPDVVNHPRVEQLRQLVGYPPALRVFQYTFTPLRLRLIQRLETGAELYTATQEQDAPTIVVHTVNAYYIAYRSNSGLIYGETPGGARAYMLVERNMLRPPQIYVMRLDKHRHEIGVRIPIGEEQVRQLTAYLFG